MTRRTYFLAGFLLQLLMVFGLYVPYVLLVNNGTKITLETIPVDPRSIFRGDYVILGYEVGQDIPWTDLADDNGNPPSNAYIVLQKNGDIYERVSASIEKPTLNEGQVCLVGANQWWFGESTINLTIPDLAQYFVEEGLGLELEAAVNTHRLLVDAAVSDDCTAVITGVRIGQEAPLETELPTGMEEFPPRERL